MTAKYAVGGAFGQILKDPHFWAPAAAAGAGAAVTGLSMAVQKMTQAKQQARSYKEMLDLHPHLKTRDGDMVKRIYSSLHRANPMMASDPMVSGAWVDTIMESGGMDRSMMSRALLEGVKDLAQIRSHISQSTQRESNVPKTIGATVQRQIEHGFTRAKDLEREVGEVGALRKQIEERNEAEKRRSVMETFDRAGQRLNDAQKNLLGKLEQKGMKSPEAMRYVAGVTSGNIPPLSQQATSFREVDMRGHKPRTVTAGPGFGEHLGDVERALHDGRAHRFGSQGRTIVSGRGKTSGLLDAVRAR